MVGCPRLAALDLRTKGTAASRVNRLGSGSGLFLGSIVALAIHYGAGVYPADVCVDQGGFFKYGTQTCPLIQSNLASHSRSRHWLNVVPASLASFAGLILMWWFVLR